MNIKSSKKTNKPLNAKKILEFFGSPYILAIIITAVLVALTLIIGISWGFSIIILILTLVVSTIVINVRLGYYNNLDYSKYLSTITVIFLMFTPIIWSPMLNDYKNVERIDETLELNASTKVYYNDGNNILILFVGDSDKPLTIDKSDNSNTYNELKAGLLGNDFKVVKKKVRNWYDDKITIDYYLDGYKFH